MPQRLYLIVGMVSYNSQVSCGHLDSQCMVWSLSIGYFQRLVLWLVVPWMVQVKQNLCRQIAMPDCNINTYLN